MRIRIRRAIAGVIDGVSLSHFVPGLSYDVSESLGGYLVSSGDADIVPGSTSAIASGDDRPDFSVFGGVIVANQLDSAADRTAPARKRRKRR